MSRSEHVTSLRAKIQMKMIWLKLKGSVLHYVLLGAFAGYEEYGLLHHLIWGTIKYFYLLQ